MATGLDQWRVGASVPDFAINVIALTVFVLIYTGRFAEITLVFTPA